MSVKIRLTRIGRHKDPFFRIVAADSRFARDGRYIEQIGYFDPAKGIENAVIDEELAFKWLNNGAILSDTVKAMFNRKGFNSKFALSKKTSKPKKKASAKVEKPASAPKTAEAAPKEAKKTTAKKQPAKKVEK